MGRWYKTILEMVPKVALAPPMPRRMVEKALVNPRVQELLETGDLMAWLKAIYNARRSYFQPFTVAEPTGPYTTAKRIPKKRSAEDRDIIFQNDTTAIRRGNLATYDIAEFEPTYWGMGGEYHPGDNLDPIPPETGPPLDRFSGAYETNPFVTGRTVYDPFPYPDLNCYFWADLSHMVGIWTWYQARWFLFPNKRPGSWPVVVSERTTSENSPAEGFARFPPADSSPSGYRTDFELWASVDGGETWEGPCNGEFGSGATNYTGGEHGTGPGGSYFYDHHAIINLLSLGTTDQFGNDTGPIKTGGYIGFGQVYQIRQKFRRKGVLMKFRVRTDSASDRIYITRYGVRAMAQSFNWLPDIGGPT